MADIKMEDVFKLPLRVECCNAEENHYFIVEDVGTPPTGERFNMSDIVVDGISQKQAEAICLAVNTHDRIEAENALLEIKKSLDGVQTPLEKMAEIRQNLLELLYPSPPPPRIQTIDVEGAAKEACAMAIDTMRNITWSNDQIEKEIAAIIRKHIEPKESK